MSKSMLMVLLIWATSVNAQFGPEQVISTVGNGPQCVFSADLDGDSLKDVISANKFGSNVMWYKNLGDGTFGPQQIIASINQTIHLYAADLDGDLDNDVMAVSGPDNLVVWYENEKGTFSPQNIIDNNNILANKVIASDIDGDLDLDVISSSDGTDSIYWYENLDGLGNFSTRKVIATSGNNGRSIFAVDIDSDNDIDILASSSGNETISWYENLDGLGNFSPPNTIAGAALAVSSVFAADLDGDLDMDVIATTNAEDKVAWFENTDGMGNFGFEQVISTQADFALSVFATDLDNDNDIDILSASASDNKIAWYKNLDGQGNFSSELIITDNSIGARSVFSADLDNDGDMDVLSASQNDDKIAWYENFTILGLTDIGKIGIKVYPNPANNILVIESPISINKVIIYNILGSKLHEVTQNTNAISIEGLPRGLLLVQLNSDKGKIIEKVIKE